MLGFLFDVVGKGWVVVFKVDFVEIGLMIVCVLLVVFEFGSICIVIMVFGVELGVIMKWYVIFLKNRSILLWIL